MEGRLRKSEWEVHPVGLDTAARLVRLYHYARGGSNTATFLHGLYRRGKDCVCYGVAWWLPPTKAAAVRTARQPSDRHPDGVGCGWQQVLSLSRLVLAPGVPKNAATFLLARSTRAIARSGAWPCLVTYADTWQGHTGHIYRVAGWEYLGLTDGEEVWVDRGGRMVSRKAGPTTRTRAEMLALGCASRGKFPRHKFRLVLPARRRRAAVVPSLFGE